MINDLSMTNIEDKKKRKERRKEKETAAYSVNIFYHQICARSSVASESDPETACRRSFRAPLPVSFFRSQ